MHNYCLIEYLKAICLTTLIHFLIKMVFFNVFFSFITLTQMPTLISKRALYLPRVQPKCVLAMKRQSRPQRMQVITQANIAVLDDVTCLVGHSIVYFTMFYCGLNWYYYRSIRKDNERNTKNK